MNVPFVDMQRLYQPLRAEVLAAFERVFDSGGFVQGAEVHAFEREFAAQLGLGQAVAVSNGTAALHLALLALDVGPGDEVITVSNSFFATAEAISAVGAVPVFADIQPDGQNIDPAAVEAHITPRTRAIIPVHLYGEAAGMPAIMAIARRHGLKVIEDACQAHGAVLNGQSAGSFGDAACFSFYPTKNLGAVGEGGMVVTPDPEVAASVARLRDHGQSAKHAHQAPGFNYRMSELQAAALRVALPHLGGWNEHRRAAAARYSLGLRQAGLALPGNSTASHVYHLYVVRTAERDALKEHLARAGIATAIHYPVPIHLQPAYAPLRMGPGSLPNTERAAAEILSLPMHPSISDAEIDFVCDRVRAFEGNARPNILAEVAR
jgi:dTDP-4-amino-4,6-dideoxygalactose transaminase